MNVHSEPITLHDIIVFWSGLEQNLERLVMVFERLRTAHCRTEA